MAIVKYSVAELQVEKEVPSWVKRAHARADEAEKVAEADVAATEEEEESEKEAE